MAETLDILNEIYSRLDRAKVIAALEPQDMGAYYLFTCPECGKREAYLYKNTSRLFCNRQNKCSFSQTLWDYVQRSQGLNNPDTLKELARLADYTLPERQLTQEILDRRERARAEADAWEVTQDYFKDQLWKDEMSAEEARDYLQDRGYSEDEIKRMELGFFASPQELGLYLESQGIQAPAAVILKSLEKINRDYKISIPYRNPAGKITGFIFKVTGYKDPQYVFTEGVKLDAPFNLDWARKFFFRDKSLIVVEGFLDALAVREKAGIENVIALGTAYLSETKLKYALDCGAASFILALDNNETGKNGVEKALDLLQKQGDRFATYVITFPAGIKTPDEFLCGEKGPDAFKELVRKAENGHKWKAKRILARYDITTDRDYKAALDEAVKYEAGIRDPIDSKAFMDIIYRELELTPELLADRLKESRELSQNQRRGVRGKSLTLTAAPYTLEQLDQDIKESGVGLATGYQELDKIVGIPQGALTLVAGRPAHGKSAFLLNLLLNMSRHYPDRGFFFFSYQESKKQIALKVINILSGDELVKTQNLKAIEAYLRSEDMYRPKLEAGRAQYKELTENKRLWISDDPLGADELADTLAYYREQHEIGAVVIDAGERIRIKGRSSLRPVELQKISEQLLAAAKELNIAIILGVQIGSEERNGNGMVTLADFKEMRALGQAAELVLGLYNEDLDQTREAGTIPADEEKLTVKVLKDSSGLVNEQRTLLFKRNLFTISER